MKKHMLKETNSMRRLMGLNLLKEESDVPTDVEIEEFGSEEEKEEVNEEEGIEDTDKGDEGDVIGAEWQADDKLDKTNIDEDSEGEETYNYGEDEGADEHREDEMEDELHHDEEDMAPHDRIKAIEDHLDALKKDMGYDEDHEDRDEEGTHFAEGKRYSKVLNTLTESQYRKLKRFIK
jgi:hypothetical protein